MSLIMMGMVSGNLLSDTDHTRTHVQFLLVFRSAIIVSTILFT
jgi:hypothetical protein